MRGRIPSSTDQLNLTLDAETWAEITAERRRLGLSRTEILQRVWEIARATIATYPGKADAPARRFKLRRPKRQVVRARSWMVQDVEDRAAEVFETGEPEGRSTAEAVEARRRGPEPEPEPKTPRDRIVAMVLEAGRPVSLAEIYEAMKGANRLTVRWWIHTARMAGRIEMLRPALYIAPGPGVPTFASQLTQLLALLAAAPRSIFDVRCALGIRHRRAKHLVKLARRRGFVGRAGPSLYRLTPAGRERIAHDAAATAAGRYKMGGRG